MSTQTDEPVDHTEAIQTAAAERREAERRLVAAVAQARAEKYSWQDIGTILGVSRQAAWERFHKRVADVSTAR